MGRWLSDAVKSDTRVRIIRSREEGRQMPAKGKRKGKTGEVVGIPYPRTKGVESLLSFDAGHSSLLGRPMAYPVIDRHVGTNATPTPTAAEKARTDKIWGEFLGSDDMPAFWGNAFDEALSTQIRATLAKATFAPKMVEAAVIGWNRAKGLKLRVCRTQAQIDLWCRFWGMPSQVGTTRVIAPNTDIVHIGGRSGQTYAVAAHAFMTTSGYEPDTTGRKRIKRVTCGTCGYSVRKCTCEDNVAKNHPTHTKRFSPGVTVEFWNGSAYRSTPPETWADGTLKPLPDEYLVDGEKRKSSVKIGQEHMNLATEDEMLEVRRICRNLARMRDAQRSRTRSDIGRVNDDSGRKPDGADMWDAMQDSVLYYVKGLMWASTLTEAAYSVEDRTCCTWMYLPARFRREAEEADIAGVEYNLDEKVQTVNKRSIMWTSARNAIKAHFTVQDAQLRTFMHKMLIREKLGHEGQNVLGLVKEVEYTQTTDDGAPGYTLGQELHLRKGKYGSGGSTSRPQYVGIAALRSSSDNPYSAETFQAAVRMTGGWDNLPLLREAVALGMSVDTPDKGGRMGVLTQMAANRNDGIIPSNRQITNMSGQLRAEWDKLRDNLDVVRDLTDRYNPYEQGEAEKPAEAMTK